MGFYPPSCRFKPLLEGSTPFSRVQIPLLDVKEELDLGHRTSQASSITTVSQARRQSSQVPVFGLLCRISNT